MSETCRTYPIGAFVDGELAGVEMLRVSQHLETCQHCADEAGALRAVGLHLREASAADPGSPELDGLAGGIVSRIRAEQAQSWAALVDRAFDGWHWFLAGAGALTAGIASIAFVAAILEFGPAPDRRDSLAALIVKLNAPEQPAAAWATTVGDDYNQQLVFVDPGSDLGSMQRELVGALNDALGRQGQSIDVHAMPEYDRLYATALFDRMNRLRATDQPGSNNPLRLSGIRLLTSTGVTAKGL
jgi:putative zinc finger protein